MIVIVGGGIAGLSLGYALVQQKQNVLVLEKATVASGASGAATCYLEPRLGQTPIRAVEWEALRRWPKFVQNLQQRTGLDVGFETSGEIKVCLAENEPKFVKDLNTREEQDWPFQHLSLDEIRLKEPELSQQIIAAAYLPDVGRANGQMVCAALAKAIELGGGEVRKNCAVIGVDFSAGEAKIRVEYEGARQSLKADKIILCNGLGTDEISDLPSDIPKSRAVRGVNLLLDQSSLSQPLRHLVKHHRGSLCPRSDGLIVGTTYEPGVTSLEPQADVIEKILTNADPILPQIRDLPLIRVMSGLRTKVGDGNLTLGRSRENPSIYFSLSHAGAGFLRAPVVAKEFAHFIVTGEPGELTGFLTKY